MEFIVLPTAEGELFEIVYSYLIASPLGADHLHIGVKRLSPDYEKIIRELFPDIDPNSYRPIHITGEHTEIGLVATPENDADVTRFRFLVPVLTSQGAQEKAMETLALTLGEEVDYSVYETAKWHGFDEYLMQMIGL